MYIIKGRDKFFQIDTYGEFDSLKECLNYLEWLKKGTLGTTIKFWWEEK